MKTLLKILIATLGSPVALLLAPASAMRRLIFGAYISEDEAVLEYSQVTWDEVWQRPQQYAWLASKKFPVIYCCPVQLHNLLYLGKKWKPVRRISKDGRRLLILSPLILSGHFKWRFINKLNCRITAMHLRAAIAESVSIRALVNTPFALPVIQHCFYRNGARSPRLTRPVYDVIDDFTVFDWSPAFAKNLDDHLMREADAVIAGTNELAEARPGARFIACGADFDLFATPLPAPRDTAHLPRPILGYFGTVSERVDTDLLGRLADHFRDATLLIIGPVHLPDHALPRRPNIHYLGLRRHADLPAYAQAFDVALIPFRITPATVKLNPVKTLEYLAAGLPVVATPLPDLKKFYADVIRIAHSHDDYIAAVENALSFPEPDRTAAGIKMARAASWDVMTEQINETLLAKPPGAALQASTELNPA